jgi:predicted ester cyclase
MTALSARVTEREGAPMTTEENKALYRRWFEEVVTGRNLALADELLAPDYVLHFPGLPAPVDREGHKQLLMMFHHGFPDWRETIDDVVAEGDRVVIRVTGRGTHQGEFQGIAPTGKQVVATGVGIGRIENGRIAESWAEYDALGMMRQLGVIPPPEGLESREEENVVRGE